MVTHLLLRVINSGEVLANSYKKTLAVESNNNKENAVPDSVCSLDGHFPQPNMKRKVCVALMPCLIHDRHWYLILCLFVCLCSLFSNKPGSPKKCTNGTNGRFLQALCIIRGEKTLANVPFASHHQADRVREEETAECSQLLPTYFQWNIDQYIQMLLAIRSL